MILSFSCPDYGSLMKCLVEDSNFYSYWLVRYPLYAGKSWNISSFGNWKKNWQKDSLWNKWCKNSCDESVKLLGVEIDYILYLLKFDSHISSICRKAAQQINILKRLGKHLTKLNNLTIFHTFIVSNFNNRPLSWHFCTERNTIKLEKLQERAFRFVYVRWLCSFLWRSSWYGQNSIIKIITSYQNNGHRSI